MKVLMGNLVLTDHQSMIEPAVIGINNQGQITEVIKGTKKIPKSWTDIDEIVDAGDNLVMPGIIDSHVHVNEPGRTEWEGFETATKACAAGGITCLVDMPLNSIPPTTTVENFNAKLAVAKKKVVVDVAFWV